ncbi:lipoprotein [Spiroplasma cantharicola]|uniref:Lipoprotein n=1 Tax=Spiroplasma cantharicola TaxID=362837 RepID=A0A0M3SJD6_9MOLU|nr:lipoprotein [Spiroplasma cantharicola]ALD66568.1 hypothetical protein SCANT_v1c06620 [Spiroplasma cantharicola]
MKKLLSLLGTISLVATSSATVVACGGSGTTDPITGPGVDYEAIIKKLKSEVDEIFTKHLNDNVYKNLIGLPDTEKQYQFLNQTKIIENTGNKASELDPYDLILLEKDIYKVLELDQLKTDLNKLKNVTEYKVILNDVNDLFKNIVFDWSSLEILSHLSNDGDKLYLGNVIVNYKIEIQYKGENEVESFTIDDNFKYTSTNSNSLKKASDEFYKNIAKDYFLSSKSEDRKHTNLNWNDIKGSKKSSDGFGRLDKEIKKYYEADSATNGFKSSIIDFIKVNYFDKVGNTLPLSFEGDLIFKSSEMQRHSMSYTVNQWKNYNDSESIKYNYDDDDGRILLDTVFRNDPSKSETKNNLATNYFKTANLKKWKQNFDLNKDEFLTRNNIDIENKVKDTKEFKSSTALGWVNLTGLSINLGKGAYIHKLPDFRIAINYFVGLDETDAQILDKMSEFTVDSLKAWHEVFGVYHGYKYPEHNSQDDFLVALKASELTKEMTSRFPNDKAKDKNSQVHFRDAFSLSNTEFYKQSKAKLFDKGNILDNSNYFMVFAALDSTSPSERKDTIFDWSANEKIGINIKWNDKNQSMNHKVLTFRYGYLNFHIDLKEITMSTKALGNKELVKFV